MDHITWHLGGHRAVTCEVASSRWKQCGSCLERERLEQQLGQNWCQSCGPDQGWCQNGCGYGWCPNGCACNYPYQCQRPQCPRGPESGYTGEEWEQFCRTFDGQRSFRWWADWMPTPDGQRWVAGKRHEARRVVEGMICKWGLRTLQAGCVMDVGGDPGFVSAELLHAGINVTVLDPAFGCSGKADPATTHRLSHSPANLTLIRKPFNQDFVDDPENASLMRNVSAFASLYP